MTNKRAVALFLGLVMVIVLFLPQELKRLLPSQAPKTTTVSIELSFTQDYPWRQPANFSVAGASPSKPKDPYRYATIKDDRLQTFKQTKQGFVLTNHAMTDKRGYAVYIRGQEGAYVSASLDKTNWVWLASSNLTQDISQGAILLYRDGEVVPALGEPAYQFVKNSYDSTGHIYYTIDGAGLDSKDKQKLTQLVAQASQRWNKDLGEPIIQEVSQAHPKTLTIKVKPGSGNSSTIGSISLAQATVSGDEEALLRIITHEFGHTLGLDHTDEFSGPQDIMYSRIRLADGQPVGQSQNVITPADIANIKLIRANGNFAVPK